MYTSRNKTDLIIEVWERLDCESIGAAELTAIEDAVRERFGDAAVESPMVLARLLAEEGAQLRHSEIMKLYVERNGETFHDVALKNIVDIGTLEAARRSIRQMENLRLKLSGSQDKEGLRLLRDKALKLKTTALDLSLKSSLGRTERLMNAEIAEWLTIWLRTPEMFETWLSLRKRSAEFNEWFGGND
jgi:hypothetical protein